VDDNESIAILKIILADEIGHVAIGSKWFHYCCTQQKLEPIATFKALLLEYMGTPVRSPLHTEARLQAGFTQQELDELLAMEQQWITSQT
jgi:uncharacterized ferritin-like protein (DUF455 family)